MRTLRPDQLTLLRVPVFGREVDIRWPIEWLTPEDEPYVLEEDGEGRELDQAELEDEEIGEDFDQASARPSYT